MNLKKFLVFLQVELGMHFSKVRALKEPNLLLILFEQSVLTIFLLNSMDGW